MKYGKKIEPYKPMSPFLKISAVVLWAFVGVAPLIYIALIVNSFITVFIFAWSMMSWFFVGRAFESHAITIRNKEYHASNSNES